MPASAGSPSPIVIPACSASAISASLSRPAGNVELRRRRAAAGEAARHRIGNARKASARRTRAGPDPPGIAVAAGLHSERGGEAGQHRLGAAGDPDRAGEGQGGDRRDRPRPRRRGFAVRSRATMSSGTSRKLSWPCRQPAMAPGSRRPTSGRPPSSRTASIWPAVSEMRRLPAMISYRAFDHFDRQSTAIVDHVEGGADIVDAMIAGDDDERIGAVVADGEGRLAGGKLGEAGIGAIEDQPGRAVQRRRCCRRRAARSRRCPAAVATS